MILSLKCIRGACLAKVEYDSDISATSFLATDLYSWILWKEYHQKKYIYTKKHDIIEK